MSGDFDPTITPEEDRQILCNMLAAARAEAQQLREERDGWRNAARAMRSAADMAANSLHMDGSNYVRGIQRVRDVWREAQQGYKLDDPAQRE